MGRDAGRHGGGRCGLLTEQGAAPSWTLYFKTSDADATAEAVRKAGGAVRAEPDAMAEGRFAQFTDPAVMFAVWQPGNTKGLGAVNDPGTLCWTELATPDVPGAKSFYSDVLGWETDDQPMGEFTYTVVRPAGGGESSGQGGIMPLSPEMAGAGATTRWQPYFEVADCDAAAAAVTANGGTVVVPASDVPGVAGSLSRSTPTAHSSP